MQADSLRIATYNAELAREGPGLLLRDIEAGKDPQIDAVLAVIAHISPDILLLNGFDYDHGGAAIAAFAKVLEARGAPYPHLFALRPNTGMATGLDMDGDGRLNTPRDTQGYGRFSGEGGMVILSRYPIDIAGVQDYSALKWVDFPGATLPQVDGDPFPSAMAQAEQRLSTTGHWIVPVSLPDGPISLFAFYASPPVFDGPEDRNGLRNHDEVLFWQTYLDGGLGPVPPEAPFVLLGDANLDPEDGDGRNEAIRNLLDDPRLQDPTPAGPGGAEAAAAQGGANLAQTGPPEHDTADWRDDPGPGNLRVDYVLPSRHWQVQSAGVFWPPAYDPWRATVEAASRHRLVWVDLFLP